MKKLLLLPITPSPAFNAGCGVIIYSPVAQANAQGYVLTCNTKITLN